MRILRPLQALAKISTTLAIVLFAGHSARAADDGLVLVKDGAGAIPIVVADDATPRTRDAAAEMAATIGKITGATPEILQGTPAEIPAHAIWVGYQPRLKELFPSVDFEFKHPEEILLAANANHLVIAGRDFWDPKRPDKVGGRPVKNIQSEYGTINAIYTFLQDKLGVRWLMPGPLGVDLIEQKTLAIAPFEYRYHPQFRMRDSIFIRVSLAKNRISDKDWLSTLYPDYYELKGSDRYDGEELAWTRQQRITFDSLKMNAGHPFNQWWEKYSKDHPDYFALRPDGTRKPVGDGKNTKLDSANPAVWKQWLVEAGQQLANDPTATVFGTNPSDGWTTGHCECPECGKWDPAPSEVEEMLKGSKGVPQIPLADREATFANTLAAMLQERYPDRGLMVSMTAYGFSRPAPVKTKLRDDVYVLMVNNFLMRGDEERAGPIQQFKDWGAVTKNLIFRPNTGSPAGWQWGMPDVAMKQVAADFRMVAELGAKGIVIDSVWMHWSTQGPLYYLMAQLAWDPYADPGKIMDDYYARSYGPAAATMMDYWNFMEDTRQKFVDKENNGGRKYLIPSAYTDDVFDKAGGYLSKAAAELKGAPDKYAQRVAFAKAGLDYAMLLTQIRAAMIRYEATDAKDDAIRKEVLTLWDQMAKLKASMPEYGIQWRCVFRTDVENTLSAWRIHGGLHPDLPHLGKMLRKYNAKLAAREEDGIE